MIFLLFILATIGVGTIWNWYWRQYYYAETKPDEVYYTYTADGWRLALSRYKSKKSDANKLPVLCCHGLGANSLTFDISSQYSFARALVASGREVWVLDLRGHGRSERARIFSKKKGCHWDIDTLVSQDVPAAIDFVIKKTKAEKLHWLGFSMGGILGYIHLCISDEDTLGEMPAKKIASAVMIGAALDYSKSASKFKLVKSLRVIAGLFPMVQLRAFITATIPFTGRFPNPFESFVVWSPNTDPKTFRRLAASGFDVMSTKLLVQLSTLFDEGGISSSGSSKKKYFDLLPRITTPVFSIAGSKDGQCPPEAVRKTHKHIGTNRKRMITMGRDSGHREDFGHADLIFGKESAKEVIPLIAEWLDDAEAKSTVPPIEKTQSKPA